MKKAMFFTFMIAALAAHSQTVIQPISSGDYWQINDYRERLPELANANAFPQVISFPNGYVGVSNVKANRLTGTNEIYWTVSGAQNITDFTVEYSRDLRNFERAGQVYLHGTENGTNYVFHHPFADQSLVYYRLALMRNGQVVAYTPAVQLLDEEARTKVFPTNVTGSTFYVQSGQPFERLQVVNTASQTVYEKGLANQSGTITVGLPSLPKGVYFVRLLSDGAQQHVQRIFVN